MTQNVEKTNVYGRWRKKFNASDFFVLKFSTNQKYSQ